jgi:Holliday junction resolvase
MRRSAHVDANQKAIVYVLRKCGANVVSLAAQGKGVPDLLVQFRGKIFLLEVKNLAGRGKRLTDPQKAFHATWDAAIVTNETDALKAIGAL